MAIYQPDYKVHFNRATGSRCVVTGKGNPVYISKCTNGGKREFYVHYKTGRQSQLFPTLRDCINNIVYGV